MSPIVQHIIALSAVALCVGYVGWQGVRTLAGKRSRVGNCCAQGCDPQRKRQGGDPAAKTSAGGQVAFIPVEMLTRRRKP
ncbi:MAG TPA: hypothetical protein VF796_09175 [Humisphaera sp.]